MGRNRMLRAARRAGLALGVAMLLFVIATVAGGAAEMRQGVTLPESIPDFSADVSRPTVASVQSGDWSSPITWAGGQVPTAGNVVRIVLGHTVTINDTTAEAYTIAVDGTLAFAPTVNTRLKVTNLQVMAGEMGMGTRGILQVGTAATPIAADVTAEIIIANSALGGSVADPLQFGTGLTIFGKASMHGSVRTPTFARLLTEPHAGNTTLTLSAPVSGWRVGDRLVLPDTRHIKESEVTGGGWINAVNQWEEKTVQAVSGDGLTVTLNSSLQYDHLGARDQAGVLDPGFLPHVGNITRNVIIRSENPLGTRGHTLATHVADVDMRYVLFKDLGRTKYTPLNTTTNHIGRYPVHMHHLSGLPAPRPADSYQFTLLGNAVDGGSVETQFKWGIAVHGSHYGLIQDNVIYNYNGASVATEDGSESFNLFDHNFALRGIGEPNDPANGIEARSAMGTEGVGFWFRGPNNLVRNNVAANFQNPTTEAAYGFVFQFRFLGNITVPLERGANTFMGTGPSTTVNGNNLPLLQFSNNEAYGAMQGGFTYWWISSSDPDPFTPAQESRIQDLKLWNIYNKAVYMYPGQKVTFDGLKIRGSFHVDNRCCGDGVYAADYSSKGIVIRNSDIQGMTKGITAPMAGFGPEPNLSIQDSHLRNLRNVVVPTNGSVNGCWMENKLIVVSNTLFDAVPGQSSTHIGMVGDVANVSTLCPLVLDEARVYAYNADATDNFQVYHTSASVLPRPPPACGTPTTRTGIDGLVCPIAALGPVPPTATLTVFPTSVSAGVSATLTWSTLNATTVSIDQGIGTVASFGTLSVSPTETTTYTLTATNADVPATTTATATLTVTPPDTTPPVISNVASSNLMTSGATIGFTTDELAFHQVEYGLNGLYGTSTAFHSMLMTSHTQVLTGLTPGKVYHYRVRATDASGNSSVSGDFTFTTPATPPPPSGIAVGTVVFADGTDAVTAGPFSTAAGDLVIAFATSSGPVEGGQSLVISGGLTWTLVKSENGMPGVAEIWQASSATAQSNISVTSTQVLLGGYTQSLTIVTFSGATGVGASARANGESGGPSILLTTTQPGSLVYAVGNDWYGALARTLGANQSMTHQWVSDATGDTYWVQHYNGPIATAGTEVQLNVTAPTDHRWNFAAVEITAKPKPGITWPTPASITYGTPLGATQLNATVLGSVAGTFAYAPASGTLLAAGAGQTLTLTFTPADTVTYDIATATVTINVLKATPLITWPAPAAITYGTTLSGTQLNATAPAGLAGTFAYTPASGALLGAGTGQTLSVTFTPTNTADYNAATKTVAITVAKATPLITWPTPAAITVGTALNGTQLNATTPVAGTFVYTPPSGTLLGVGAGQTLSVTFTPANTADYNPATATVALAVLPLSPGAFTDDPLQRGVSLIRAAHIIELRQRIDSVRTRLNLSPFAWSDAALSATSGTPIRAQHIIDLRSALQGIYVALNRTLPLYTDPTLVAGTTVMKLEHITELRAALVAVE